MLRAFGVSLAGQLFLLYSLTFNLLTGGFQGLWRRLPISILVALVTSLLSLLHWIGFALDELLFRGYRRVQVKAPIFVLGIPRSGTTFLQRLLAEDERLTSLTTWQCVLAPSITERKLYGLLGKVLRPLAGGAGRLQKRLFGAMERIHPIGLNEPEEDFLLLWPLQACFLVFLLCPRSAHYWRLARFDQALPAWYRRTVLDFYRRCVQKHLYCAGPERIFLSKNPSFTPLMNSLRTTFPDARLIACCRAPLEVVPSQLSSLLPGLRALGYATMPAFMAVRLIEVLEHYYQTLVEQLQGGFALAMELQQLNQDLPGQAQRLYDYLDLPMHERAAQRIAARASQNKAWRSAHSYNLAQFDLDEAVIEARFGDLWRRILKFNLL